MLIAWWVWIAIGVLLVGAELLVGGFVVIWLGLSAVLVGLFSLVIPFSTGAQLLFWTLFSALMLVVWFKVLRKRISPTKSLLGQSGSGIIGEVGLAVNDIRPFERGKVRFQWPIAGSEVWECLTEDEITAGDRVKIVSVEGNFFKVVKVASK